MNRESVILVVSVYHAEYVQVGDFLCRDGNILIGELPAIRHIATGADMRFISEKEINMSAIIKVFKFLKFLEKQLVKRRRVLL